jgi:hypothetical protein
MVVQRNALLSERALKRRRKKQIILGGGLVFIIVLLFAGVLWGAYTTSLQITEVNIRGTQGELESQIRADADAMLGQKVAWVLPKSNVFLFSKDSLHKQIEETYPKVLTVKVDTKGFNAITVDIVERKPHALWCSGVAPQVTPDAMGRCFFVDDTGYIFAPSPYFSDHVYFELYGEPSDYQTIVASIATSSQEEDMSDDIVMTGEVTFVGMHYIAEDSYRTVMSIVDLLRGVGIDTHTLVVHSKDLFELVMDEGGVIKFNTQVDPQRMVTDLKTALDAKFQENKDKTLSDIEYVDVRFTNKVVFKFVE